MNESFFMKNTSRFVVIDNDPISNALCKMMINNVLGEIEVRTFTQPEKGFKYISSEHAKYDNGFCSIILLDLNMPSMTGWKFLKLFEELDEKIKNKFKIYIHSSSADPLDKQRARSNKYVVDYIVKPLTEEMVRSLSIK
ncbi:MAG TPA: response regulator [Ignavibacteriaceae bacterium]|nr:response regulator [Ignavibacteriaceae bacterium]